MNSERRNISKFVFKHGKGAAQSTKTIGKYLMNKKCYRKIEQKQQEEEHYPVSMLTGTHQMTSPSSVATASTCVLGWNLTSMTGAETSMSGGWSLVASIAGSTSRTSSTVAVPSSSSSLSVYLQLPSSSSSYNKQMSIGTRDS